MTPLISALRSHPWICDPQLVWVEPSRAALSLAVHANVEHAATNGIAAVLLGVTLAHGTSARFAAGTFVAGGILGNVLAAVAAPAALPWVGASGAVFALAGALAGARRAWWILLAIATLIALTYGDATIASAPHIAGALVGLAFGLMRPTKKGPTR